MMKKRGHNNNTFKDTKMCMIFMIQEMHNFILIYIQIEVH